MPNLNRIRESFRHVFHGVKINVTADACPPDKSPYVQNVRAYGQDQVRTRPGQNFLFNAGAGVTDIATFSELGTDNSPVILARRVDDLIVAAGGTVATMAQGGGPGVSMIPFRPGASPNPYMYVASASDYQKISSDLTVAEEVGIAEPQSAPDACPNSFLWTEFTKAAAQWAKAGTAGTPTDGTRSSDTITTIIDDSASGMPGQRFSIEVEDASVYQIGETITVGTSPAVVQDVIPPFNAQGQQVGIEAIYYFDPANTGHCVIVPTQIPTDNSIPQIEQGAQSTQPIPTFLSSLRRGALVTLGGNVLPVNQQGPNLFSQLFETTTPYFAWEFVGGTWRTVSPPAGITNFAGFNGFRFNIPLTANIIKLEVQFSYASQFNTTAMVEGVQIRYGGTPTNPTMVGTPVNPSLQFTPLGAVATVTGTFGVSPLTPVIVNDPTFGFGVRATYEGVRLFISTGKMSIFYTIGATTGETVFVQSATVGPDGTICFETSTVSTHGVGESIQGVPTVVGSGLDLTPTGSVTASEISCTIGFALGSGIGSLTQTLTQSPFSQQFQNPTVQNINPQDDDYIHISLNVNILAQLNEMKLLFDVGDGTFRENFYYYTIDPSVLQQAVNNAITQQAAVQLLQQQETIAEENQALNPYNTQLPAIASPGDGQWAEIMFPVSELTRVGTDESKSLSNCGAVQILFNVTASTDIIFGSLWVGGGGQPDTGGNNSPYLYRFRLRDSVTGAVSNPSSPMRYGIFPRRQNANIALPLPASPYNYDTFDIFRYGGTVTSYRYIGSLPISAQSFTDTYSDESAQGGDVLDFDNFQPWPSVDTPLQATAAEVVGTTALLISSRDLSRYLPGTLVQIGGQNVYTLWDRPTSTTLVVSAAIVTASRSTFPFAPAAFITATPHGLASGNPITVTGCSVPTYNGSWFVNQIISPTEFTVDNAGTPGTTSTGGEVTYINNALWLLQFIENAGSGTNSMVTIQEPLIANQHLPYVWGPNEYGDVFACGDSLRPGTVYFAKSNNPDSAPDTNNLEITPPSEPLLGGEILDGKSYVASSDRWWELYVDFSNPNRYRAIQANVPRGLGAPFGHCTDGRDIYFWAKDGIWSLGRGSLTDADLYPLFPHEGVVGQDYQYGNYHIYAPDYAYSGQFRLSYANSYLYADYVDSTGTPHNLVCDLRTMAWSPDVYSLLDPVTVHYSVPQQAGGAQSIVGPYAQVLMSGETGDVSVEQDLVNDLPLFGGPTTPIDVVFSTTEWDGGDLRNLKLWADVMADLITQSPVLIYPISFSGEQVQGFTPVVPSTVRQQVFVNTTQIPLGITEAGGRLRFLGIQYQWTDDFEVITSPTKIFSWQPSYWGPLGDSLQQWVAEPTTHGIPTYHHVGRIIITYISDDILMLQVSTYDGEEPALVQLPATGGVKSTLVVRLQANKGLNFTYAVNSVSNFQLFELIARVKRWGSSGPYQEFPVLRMAT